MLKVVAEGNARLCASDSDMYWTACAAEPIDMITAIGGVHVIHPVMNTDP